MKAPKKIYVANNVFPTHVDWDGSPINTKRIDDSDIEYICADVLIRKACEYLQNTKRCVVECIGENVYKPLLSEEEIEDFKTYMKKE